MSTKIHFFRNATDTVNFEAGATIFETGDAGTEMYCIVEGEVEIVLDGKLLETLTDGDIFGELAIIDPDNRRGATARAKTAVRLAAVDEKRFSFLVKQTPFFAIQVMRVIAARLRTMNAYFRAAGQNDSK